MRVLVVGYGSMGRRHARHARQLGHSVVVWDSDKARQLDAIAGGFEKPTVGLDAVADAVVLAIPAAGHAPALKRIAKTSRVFVEKPLALSMEDFWTIGPLANEKRVCVGYQFRFQPHVRRLREILDLQASAPRFAVLHLACDMSTWPGANYADALLECSHEIDLAQHLFGPAEIVRARVREDIGEWTADLWCGAETLVSVRIHAAAVGRYERFVSVFGRSETGSPRYEWAWHGPTETSVLHVEGHPDEQLRGIGDAVYLEELRQFLDGDYGDWADAGGCTLQQGLSVVRLCDRMKQLALREAAVEG